MFKSLLALLLALATSAALAVNPRLEGAAQYVDMLERATEKLRSDSASARLAAEIDAPDGDDDAAGDGGGSSRRGGKQ